MTKTISQVLSDNRKLVQENKELSRKNSDLQTDNAIYKNGMKNWQEAHGSLSRTLRSVKLDLDAYRRLYTFLTLNKAELDSKIEKETISDRMKD